MFIRRPIREESERRRRRRLEISIASDALRRFIRSPAGTNRRPRILEVGTGKGCQLKQLNAMGDVVASDLVRDPKLADVETPFVWCDITRAPFVDGAFDLVYCCHVLDSVVDLKCALTEMRRVCAPRHGIVAAIVATSLWIWLSIPFQVLDQSAALLRHLRVSRRQHSVGSGCDHRSRLPARKPGLLRGHGRYRGFWEFHCGCRPAEWRKQFKESGLDVVHEERLLLCGPSQCPVVPTSRWVAKMGISSERLFILRPRTA